MWPKIFAWVTSAAGVLTLHKYFLDFANAIPDLTPSARPYKRLIFNFIQLAAGNKDRVVTKLPNSQPAPAVSGEKEEA